MSVLTGLVLGGLAAWILAMILGAAPTDFTLFLFVCTLVTGVYALVEIAFLRPRRRLAAGSGAPAPVPWWVEYTAGFFPVIAIVFCLRSFLFEPFRIPSGSMIPTLQIGDLILVNKYQYGVRLPVLNDTVVEVGHPARGDVIVFRYPHDTSQDYIKRVVGLPGDVVEYRAHVLTINGNPVQRLAIDPYYEASRGQSYRHYIETLGKVQHDIIEAEGDGVSLRAALQYPNRSACDYSEGGVRCTVPADHYFVMGDNRDNSEDSRFWGFVPDRNIKGRAFFIWMNLRHVGRIGSFH